MALILIEFSERTIEVNMLLSDRNIHSECGGPGDEGRGVDRGYGPLGQPALHGWTATSHKRISISKTEIMSNFYCVRR